MSVCVNHTRGKHGKGKKYLRIRSGPQKQEYVHRLIGAALVRRPLRENECVDHFDGNGLNPWPGNLRIMTVAGNSRARQNTPLKKLDLVLDGATFFPRQPSNLLAGKRSPENDSKERKETWRKSGRSH